MRDRQARLEQGLISGFVLKLIRESLGLTQEGLAEQLDVDGTPRRRGRAAGGR